MKIIFTKKRVILKKLTFCTFLFLYYVIVFSQSQIITGTVSDGSGSLPGVSVILQGSSTVGITDNKGQYTLISVKQLSNADTLVFRYKGPRMVNKMVMPVRFKYPTTVATNGSVNYKKAVVNMGGDDINTKLYWKKNYEL